ncbi:MAG: PilN domain-containing protein [Actinomycetota bacterium]
MRAVNLLPRDAGSRKSIRNEDPAVVVGASVGAVVLLALAFGFMNVHSKVTHEQSKLDAARRQLAQLSLHRQPIPKPTKQVKTIPIIPQPAVSADEQPRLDAVKAALSQRIDWDRIMREFSLVLPSDISITSLQLGAPAAPGVGATTGTPGTLTINGSAYSHDGVARFMSRLMLIPDFMDVTLQNSSADTSGVTFSINASIKGAVAPPAAAPPAVPTTPTDTTATTTSDGSSS